MLSLIEVAALSWQSCAQQKSAFSANHLPACTAVLLYDSTMPPCVHSGKIIFQRLNPSSSMPRHDWTEFVTPKSSLCMFVPFTGSGDIASSAMPFPQAWSLSGALQEAQLQLLGKVMGVCAPAEQVRMLDGLRTSASGKVSKQRERGDVLQQQQHTVAARACIATLSGLQALVDRYKGMHPHRCSMYMSRFTDNFRGSACSTRCMPCSRSCHQ